MPLPRSSRQASRLLVVRLCKQMLPPCRWFHSSAGNSRTSSSWWPLLATSARRSTRAKRPKLRDSAALDCAVVVNAICPLLVKRCWEEALRAQRSHAVRALHGNTPGITPFSTCWLASFNSDGLTAAGRWDTLLSYNYDILCLQKIIFQLQNNSYSPALLPYTACGVHRLLGAQDVVWAWWSKRPSLPKCLQSVGLRIILVIPFGPLVVFRQLYFIFMTIVPLCCTTCMARQALENLLLGEADPASAASANFRRCCFTSFTGHFGWGFQCGKRGKHLYAVLVGSIHLA